MRKSNKPEKAPPKQSANDKLLTTSQAASEGRLRAEESLRQQREARIT